jgi:zinc protease
MENPYFSTRLSNGLEVRLKEIRTAPIISHWVWYRVGSRNEHPGITGISHWVEHMQFKGTPKFPPGVLDRVISREGGQWNAFTYLDWTTFFETLPAEKIDIALELEADRMVNSRFDPDEVNSERTVIISEREGNENDPLFRLGEKIQSSAYKKHAYHHEIIGDKKDLRKITRDQLYSHYKTHYGPNNAVLAIAGDFSIEDILPRIEAVYGGISPIALDHGKIEMEPPAAGEQRVTVSGAGETTFLQVAYRSPAASNPDFFAFTIVDSLLTGPTGLNMFGGGGISNKTSRLYRALVERGLVVSVNGGLQATIDPFLYDMTITVHPDHTPDEVLSALDDEIERIQEETVAPEEIARATKQARALFAYGSENITNQAFWLGYAEMFAAYEWFTSYVDRLAAISSQDVQTIAQTYLQPQNRVVGIYQPRKGGKTA